MEELSFLLLFSLLSYINMSFTYQEIFPFHFSHMLLFHFLLLSIIYKLECELDCASRQWSKTEEKKRGGPQQNVR